jgi:hypothetical protein
MLTHYFFTGSVWDYVEKAFAYWPLEPPVHLKFVWLPLLKFRFLWKAPYQSILFLQRFTFSQIL